MSLRISLYREILSRLTVCHHTPLYLSDPLLALPPHGRCVLVPASCDTVFTTLNEQGGVIFPLSCADLIKSVENVARSAIGSPYLTTAMPNTAPTIFSCSTFVAWVFAAIGIHLPRYAIDQSYEGLRCLTPPRFGLAFFQNKYPLHDFDRAIGHVGIKTMQNTLIHGSITEKMIVEEPLTYDVVLYTNPFPSQPSLLLVLPDHIQGVQTALDLARWLQRPLRNTIA